MDEAERCDALLLLRDGELIASGTPDELRARTGEHGLERSFCAWSRRRHDGLRCDRDAARVLAQLRRDPRTIALIVARPVRARDAAQGALPRAARGLPARRCAAPRAVPVRLDVRRHVGDDAAGAHLGDARAADDDAAREAGRAGGLRSGVRAARRGPGGRRLRVRVRPARPRGDGAGVGGRRAGGRERDARDGARAVRQRIRDNGVPGGAVHAGDRAAAVPALRSLRRACGHGDLASRHLGGAAPDVRLRRAGEGRGGRARTTPASRSTSASSWGRSRWRWRSGRRRFGGGPTEQRDAGAADPDADHARRP